MAEHQEHLMDHEYDGIREYDNPTPGWWHAIFLGTIFFSLFYFLFFTLSPIAWTPQSAWAKRKTAEDKKAFALMGELKNDEATLVRLMNDPTLMNIASGKFIGTCAACHAADGGGLVGVNMTDDHYKNVTSLTDIYRVITDGAANGAMPAQRSAFSENDRILLSAYVASLRGTRPAAPKAAEGEVLPPWPTAPGAAESK